MTFLEGSFMFQSEVKSPVCQFIVMQYPPVLKEPHKAAPVEGANIHVHASALDDAYD